MLYICNEGKVERSRVIYATKLGYTLLLQDFDLVIIIPIGATISNIDGNIIYTSLAIGVKNMFRSSNTISKLWMAWYIIIVDEVSIVELEMLSNIRKQLTKASDLSNSNIAIFRGLLIVIVVEDFYQFSLIARHLLWKKPQIDENHNGKTLWLSFSSIITLI